MYTRYDEQNQWQQQTVVDYTIDHQSTPKSSETKLRYTGSLRVYVVAIHNSLETRAAEEPDYRGKGMEPYHRANRHFFNVQRSPKQDLGNQVCTQPKTVRGTDVSVILFTYSTSCICGVGRYLVSRT